MTAKTAAFVFLPKIILFSKLSLFLVFVCFKKWFEFLAGNEGNMKHVHRPMYVILFGECAHWMIVLSVQHLQISWIAVFFSLCNCNVQWHCIMWHMFKVSVLVFVFKYLVMLVICVCRIATSIANFNIWKILVIQQYVDDLMTIFLYCSPLLINFIVCHILMF